MATERFPKRKYLKQLRDMREDLWWWEGAYRQGAQQTPVEYLQGRFLDRAAVLEELRHQLATTFELLEALPRLS